MRKIRQDRPFLKILTFGPNLCKSQLSENWIICTISESRRKKRIPKSECMRKTELVRPFMKILTFWSKSKVRLVKAFFFSLFFFSGSSDQVRFPSRSGSNWVVEDDIIHDVIILGACVSAWRVAHGSTWNDEGGDCRRVWARDMTLVITGPSSGAWQRVVGFLTWNFQVW